MAHTKAQKATKGNRDSFSKRLGIKVYGAQKVQAGGIIIRQRGNKYFGGRNVMSGKDHTLMAKVDGTVEFYTRLGKKYVKVV